MGTGRLEAFSDGVFAIAITLLILTVDLSHAGSGPLAERLLQLWPSYVAYGVSFLTIGIMWANHHDLFRQIGRTDRTLVLLNLMLLMLIAFIPFPTRVVAEFARSGDERRAAALLYGITLTTTAIFFLAVWLYASRRGRLLHADADPRAVSGITRSYLPGSPTYGLATLLALVSPIASLVMFGAIAVFYALSSSVFGRAGDER
jgi:uncharacterized membrane protein